MTPRTQILSAIITWYLSFGSPTVCLGSFMLHASSKGSHNTVQSEPSMAQLTKEIKAGNIENISEILKTNKQLVNQLDETGKSPLMLAIALRKTKVIKHLLNNFSEHINFGLTDRRSHATALDYANFVETKHIYNMLIPYY